MEGSITPERYQCTGCKLSIRADDYCRCRVGQQKELADAHAEIAQQKERKAAERAAERANLDRMIAEAEVWAASPEGIAEVLAEQAQLEREAEAREAEAANRKAAAEAASGPRYTIRTSGRERRKAAVKESELSTREGWAARGKDRLSTALAAEAGSTDADGPPVGLSLADFTQEVTLLNVERLPSALERLDGETLLYQGLDNTIYGEVSIGKSWLALMAAIQQLRAGARVIWWDAEDKPTTLARRLQLLKATNLIGHHDLKWASGDLTASPGALSESLEFLDGGSGPGLVVIDSATAHGCPADGATVQPWMAANVKPWLAQGNTTLLMDHVPKQKKDRPDGGVGSYQKLQDLQGAGLYVHGKPWNATEGGELTLTVHKDRHGQLPAPKYGNAATVYVEWAEDRLTLEWSVGLPNAKPAGENLEDELLEAIDRAGAEGVKGSRGIRELLKGKRAKDIDAARNELESVGLIQHVKVGNTHVYTVVK